MSNNLSPAEKDKVKSSKTYYQNYKNSENDLSKRNNETYRHRRPSIHKYNSSKDQKGFWYAIYKLSPKYGIPIIIMIAISFASSFILKDTSSNVIQLITGIINAVFILVIGLYMCINDYMDEHSKSSKLSTEYFKYSKPINEIIKIHEHDKNKKRHLRN